MIHTFSPDNRHAEFSLLDLGVAGDLSAAGHFHTMGTTGWSMFPAIHKGDAIEVGPADSLAVGDVVVFHQEGSLVCHRVVDIGASGDVRTQGDHANGQDPPVRHQDILGKVTMVIRGSHRFPPAAVAGTRFSDACAMRLDLRLTAFRNSLHDTTLSVAAFLKRRAWCRAMALRILKKCVRVDVGICAPIRLVKAYRFLPFHKMRPDMGSSGDLIIRARLGRHPIGTFHPASGALHLRRLATGLGLEDWFRDLGAHVRDCDQTHNESM